MKRQIVVTNQFRKDYRPAGCRFFRILGYGACPIAAKPQQAPQVAQTWTLHMERTRMNNGRFSHR